MIDPRRAIARLPLLLLLACAGKDAATDDPTDTDPDTVPPVDTEVEDTDVEPAEVTVTVLDAHGVGRADVPVVVHAPDGSVASTTTTDAQGVARADVEEDGAVTLWDEANDRLVTFTALRPGDALRLADDPAPPDDFDGTAYVSIDPNLGSDLYVARTGCGEDERDDASSPLEVPYGAACLHGGRFDVLALAGHDGALDAWAASFDVQPGVGAGTDVSLQTWRTDWATPAVSIHDAPEEAWHFVGEVAAYRHGLRFLDDRPEVDLTDGGASVSPKVPTELALEAQVTGTLYLGVHYTARSQLLVRRAKAVPDPVDFDGADAPLPPLAGASDDTDPARPRITWSGATPLDAALLDLSYVSASGPRSWWFLVPGDATSLRVPALPDALAELAPIEGASGRQLHVRAGSVEGVDARALRLREHDRLRTELLREGEASGRRAEIALPIP